MGISLSPSYNLIIMQDNTYNKFAAILAAAQAKLGAIPVKPLPTQKPQPQPVQPVSIPVNPQPELSTVTVDDLLQTATKPALEIVDYSEKAFAIIGQTKAVKGELAQLGGKFNQHLRCGAGWIFPKTRLQAVKAALAL